MLQSGRIAVLLCIHCLICLLVWLLMRLRILKVQRHVTPVLVLVPLWGALCVLLLHLLHVTRLEGTVEAGVEKLHINEDAHRSLLMEEMNNQRSVVPLQEALIMNDASLRRSMMLDMLYENPEDYHELLREAIANEDGEVVHYATTAMAELSKKYETLLQQMEKAYADHPEDEAVLREYCDFLSRYLDMNLLEGQIEQVQRRQYAQLLEKCVRTQPEISLFEKLAQSWMKLGDYAAAEETIAEMERRWPEHESTLLCRMELAVRQNDRRGREQLLRQAENTPVFMSAQAREKWAFFAGETHANAERNPADETQPV